MVKALIDTPSTYNGCSDYFMNHLRLRCAVHMGSWHQLKYGKQGTPKQIWSSIGGLWRGVNSTQDLSPKSVMEVLRLGTYIATQFKPIVAKVIYNMTDAKTVLDTSMGWGDRLAGFLCIKCYSLYWL